MAKQSMHGNISLRETEDILLREIPECGITCELSDRVCREHDGVRFSVMVFERYYMRTDNYASLTVAVSGRDGDVCIDLISAGARAGVIGFTWGAEENFVRKAADVLRRHGFE